MVENVTILIEEFILGMGMWAPIAACLLILVESMIPVLPLCTFITINFISFGNIFGFIISWIFTCLGCIFSYYLVKKGFRNWQKTRLEKQSLLDTCLDYVNNLKFPSLTVVLSLPFTPAFMMNIAAGMIQMNFKKFLCSILISKIFMVYFWGYIGVGVIESFSSPIVLLKIVGMLLIAFSASHIISFFVKDK